MLSCQRDLFLLPEEVSYFNTAYLAPKLKALLKAGEAGLVDAARPWETEAKDFFTDVERARSLFAELIGTDADNVALMPSASYGIETAIRNLTLDADGEIILLADQFPSNVYPWRRFVRRCGGEIVTVARPNAGSWSDAVIAQISDRTQVLALPHCHWTDGTKLDLVRIAEAARQAGAAVVLDVTQSLGAVPLDFHAIDPDFLVSAGYKWLLGPYTIAFCYVAPRHQDGEPLEENWVNRKGSQDFARLVDYTDDYLPGARRFDYGERNNPILVPMMNAALAQILDWGVEQIAERLAKVTGDIAEIGAECGFSATPPEKRGPHMLGLYSADGSALPQSLSAHLKAQGVHVSVRGPAIRISPHLHIGEEDLSRLDAALKSAS